MISEIMVRKSIYDGIFGTIRQIIDLCIEYIHLIQYLYTEFDMYIDIELNVYVLCKNQFFSRLM